MGRKGGAVSMLARAIERKHWELAAYVLLAALLQIAERVPEESLEELVRLVVEGMHEPER